MIPFRVKVCGLTEVDNAVACVDAGAEALGLNFYPRSKRYCPPSRAAEIVRALPSGIVTVGLFVDAPLDHVKELRDRCGFEWVQLHGEESADFVRQLGPKAYKAVNGATGQLWPGPLLMVDAPKAEGDQVPGGHGRRWCWELATQVARAPGQALVLAGGLDEHNVEAALAAARPDAVDVASGVEIAPGIKDPERVRAFVRSVKVGFDKQRKA